MRDGRGVSLAALATASGLQRRTLLRRFASATGMTPIKYCRAVRIARARFADLPRTEWRLHGGNTDDAPALVIDYSGVPDTTPEFTDPVRLAASLTDRIERVKRERGT